MSIGKGKVPQSLLKARLAIDTPAVVHRALKAEGYQISLERCSIVRNNMLRAGQATSALQHYARREVEIDPAKLADSCHDLELAIKRLYRRRAQELGASPAAVRDFLNYSRVQLKKMAA